MPNLSPILAAPGDAKCLSLGDATMRHRIGSDQTAGAFSVVEFVSEPGTGVDVHTHQHEDELVYLLEGQIEVSLGGQAIPVAAGACALLPRGIAHGYTNTGTTPSRLLAVLLPGRLDRFFVGLDAELGQPRDHEPGIRALCREFGLTFSEAASA